MPPLKQRHHQMGENALFIFRIDLRAVPKMAAPSEEIKMAFVFSRQVKR